MVKVIGIGGSPRAGGNTDVLLQQVLSGVQKAGVQTETIYLRDYFIQSCIGCELCRIHKTCVRFQDDMQLLYPKIEEARGIVIGSPTYNYNVTTWTKSFLDRLYSYYDFTDDRPRKYSSRLAYQERKGMVFSVCEQPDISEMGCTLDALSRPLEALGYEILCRFPVTSLFDPGIAAQDTELMNSAFRKGFDLGKKLTV